MIVVLARSAPYFSEVTICFPTTGPTAVNRALFSLLLRRPWRIPALVGMAWAFRARDWYRRAPFLPLPPRDYLRWRTETAYGDPDAVPPVEELDGFVVWSARMRRWMRE